jgi:hypothetical protein
MRLPQPLLNLRKFNSRNKRSPSRSLMSSQVILSKSHSKERETKIKVELRMLFKKLQMLITHVTTMQGVNMGFKKPRTLDWLLFDQHCRLNRNYKPIIW